MNTVQLDADILRNLGIIAEDENMLDKVAKYLRRVVKQMGSDPTLMSKEEFFARVDEAKQEIADGKGRSFTNIEELDRHIRSL